MFQFLQIKNIKDKNFAIIIDEVYSSQEGKYSNHLKIALSNNNIKNFDEGENDEDLTGNFRQKNFKRN